MAAAEFSLVIVDFIHQLSIVFYFAHHLMLESFGGYQFSSMGFGKIHYFPIR